MITWHKDGAEDAKFETHIRLPEAHWYTINPNEPSVVRAGYDYGGEIHLDERIIKDLKTHESFTGFTVARRAARSMFSPTIIVEEEILPESMTTVDNIASISRGKHYDIYISFVDKNEAALYKLTFPDNFGLDYGGGV